MFLKLLTMSRFDYNYDFLGQRKFAIIFSIALSVISLLSLGIKGMHYGLDFTGGTLIELSYTQSADLESIRDSLRKNGFEDAIVQHFGTTKDVMIRLGLHPELNNETLSNRVLEVVKMNQTAQVELKRIEFVGAQVGSELIQGSILATLITLVGVLLYVALRFEYRFGLGAVLALLHDPIITLGIFSLFDLEFDLIVLAAILSGLGFSINHIIVVYDRIRENFLTMRKPTIEETINIAINQTLTRTIMTTIGSMFGVLAIFFFGGEVLHNFSIALAVGIIIGTYSSVYIASALALYLGVEKKDLMPVVKEGANLDSHP